MVLWFVFVQCLISWFFECPKRLGVFLQESCPLWTLKTFKWREIKYTMNCSMLNWTKWFQLRIESFHPWNYQSASHNTTWLAQSYSPYNMYTLYNVTVFIPFLPDPLFISLYCFFFFCRSVQSQLPNVPRLHPCVLRNKKSFVRNPQVMQ